MIGAVILAHLWGDYVLQTDWMAQEKTRRWWPALVHGLLYTLPFLLITHAPAALVVIAGTHVLIDRWRLAKYVVWARGQLGPARYRPSWPPTASGMREGTPDWLGMWLLFIVDNAIHLAINVGAIRWL